MQTKMLINGALVTGNGANISVINPATGCDMSVYSLDAYTAIRHVMVAH